MKARIVLVAILALFSVSAFAGDYGYGHGKRLLNAAAELDRAAQYYAKQVHYYAHSRKFNKAARKFARATAHFCYLVEQGADIYDLHHAFERVESRYHRLHRYASSYQRASYGYSKVPDIYKIKYAFDDVGRIVQRKYNRHAGYGSDQYGYRKRGYRDGGVIRGRFGNGRLGLAFSYRD